MSKRAKFLFLFASIFVCILLCASVILNVFAVKGMNDALEIIKKQSGEQIDNADEDGVVIAEQYRIESTKQISDAYISGDSSGLSDRDKETLKMAKDVLAKIIKPDMSDYKKEKAVYVYLTKTMRGVDDVLTVVSPENENSNPHDVLKNGSAVCVGYATTFRMFMQMLGIECRVVHSSNLTHTWNLIRLDDGWYHSDCYSDDSGTLFMNFNMNDDYCSINHDWTRENYPAAEGKKYNYFLTHSKELKNVYSIPRYVAEKLDGGKKLIACSFKSLDRKEQEIASYICDSIQSRFVSENKGLICQWISDGSGGYIFIVSVTMNQPSGNDLDDETMRKIDDLIGKIADEYGYEAENPYTVANLSTMEEIHAKG